MFELDKGLFRACIFGLIFFIFGCLAGYIIREKQEEKLQKEIILIKQKEAVLGEILEVIETSGRRVCSLIEKFEIELSDED